MQPQDFDFALPASQIAQHPPAQRGQSRLMTLDRRTGQTGHRMFAELPELLGSGDLLIVNDTRVVPARLLGHKAGTGGKSELLLVRPAGALSSSEALEAGAGENLWHCLGQASKGLKPGSELVFLGGLFATIRESRGGGEYVVAFRAEGPHRLGELLALAGKVPLPPYIEREPDAQDASRYQTVYARVAGSVAAPTAGLHFTEALLKKLEARGVSRAQVTLDVGPGTFLPVREDDLARHVMHSERYDVPEATARAVTQARRAGQRVVAVGTTSVRALESAWDASRRELRSGPGETALFIQPGFSFQVVDALITNFHLPRSTLLMLVSALAGTRQVLAAYAEAVAQGYRFFSYGDAMLIGEGVR